MGRLDAVFREAYAHLRERAGMKARRVDFQVRFYPYAGLTSTIYKRREFYEVRLADILEDAPVSVHFSLALVLLAKIDRRLRATPAEAAVYEAWSRQPHILERHGTARRLRARRATLDAHGSTYDLRDLYRRLNREYFDALLPEVALGWSRGRSRTRFGYHDQDLGRIVLNRRLDAPDVPRVVVAYVLFHEMLHVKFGIGFSDGGRRVMHPPEFRAQERRFPAYQTAERHLAAMARSRPRRLRLGARA